MRQASKKLLASKDQAEQMAGAYIHGLLFKTGDHALSRPSAERHAHLYLTDSPCLGRFHIALEQAGIDALHPASRTSRWVIESGHKDYIFATKHGVESSTTIILPVCPQSRQLRDLSTGLFAACRLARSRTVLLVGSSSLQLNGLTFCV